MGRWDRLLKLVARLRPFDLLGMVPGGSGSGRSRVRALDKELERVRQSRLLDGLLEVEEPSGKAWFHLEYEKQPRSDSAKRSFEHWVYAEARLRQPLRTVIFYLTPGSEGRRPQDGFRIAVGGTEVCFRCETVCLWRVPVEKILARPAPGLWALAAWLGGAGSAHVERACRQLERLDAEHLGSELLGVWFEVAGESIEAEDLWAMVRRKELVMESSTYRLIRKVSREEGLKEGEKRGAQAMQQTLLALMRARLEELPPEAARVSQIEDLSLLQQVAERLIVASDPKAVTEVLRSLPGKPSKRRGKR